MASSSLPLLIQNPVTWSVAIMMTIVGLLFAWEGLIETAREKVPRVVEQVIDQVLTEMGSLGFIGLFLDTAVLHQPAVREGLVELSERVLGDEELLLETFEFLHTVFFQTAILFFAGSAFLIVQVLDTLKTVADMADAAVLKQAATSPMATTTSDIAVDGDKETYDTMSSQMDTTSQASDHDVQDLAAILLLEEAARQQRWTTTDGSTTKRYNIWQREASLTMQQRGAEAVIIRERLIREMRLEGNFRIADYLETGVFAKTTTTTSSEKEGIDQEKEEEETKGRFDFIEISPAVWIPLIPSIALANALDLSHDVVNADSVNAVASSGYFLSTPWVFWPTLVTQVVTLMWGLTNFWKMAVMKQMLLPGLEEVANNDEEEEEEEEGSDQSIRSSNDKQRREKFVLCAPMVEDEVLRKDFSVNRATPTLARPFEEQYQAPATNRVEELYGVVGGNGEEFYFNSIKFHLWKCATGWIAFSQVLPRDLYALTHPSDLVGAPDYLLPEIAVFGLFALLDLWQATKLVPTTVLNYCIITTVQDFVSKEQQQQQEQLQGRGEAEHPVAAQES